MLNYCAWCSKHINPFNFQKVSMKLAGSVEKNRFWFCCPRCMLEFNRLSEGNNFNMRLDTPRTLKIGKW